MLPDEEPSWFETVALSVINKIKVKLQSPPLISGLENLPPTIRIRK